VSFEKMRETRKTHQRHDKFKNLTVCGAGQYVVTGRVATATRPCRMCAKGGK
jgi:hypothetical protein